MSNEPEYTGGSVSYYAVQVANPIDPEASTYTAECQDIIDALGMNFNEGSAFKAIWRRAAARNLGKAKRGYDDGLYDAQKVEFYGRRMVLQAQAEDVEAGLRLPDPTECCENYPFCSCRSNHDL